MVRLGLIALVLCYFSSALRNYAHSEHVTQLVEANSGGTGPVWVVQLSDLHFSSYRPQRVLSFKKLLPPLLKLINPSLVLITGDLTDGKSKDLAAMRQDESEWMQYRDALDWVVSQSGLPVHTFFDIRGNHDKFGVPEVGGSLDFFSKYSITAQQNRSNSVQSVTLMNGDWKHLFVGIDFSMEFGLRGPCNHFGHASEHGLHLLDTHLSQWEDEERVTKIVFGHFPTSFIAGTKDGKRPEEIFAKHNVMAYICGHLHYHFGKNLLKHHHMSKSRAEFWEWELGDWKENRALRILAIDHGHASFLDLGFTNILLNDELLGLQALILITYPPDSRTMQRQEHAIHTSAEHSVRALIFSREEVISAKAVVYDSYHGSPAPVEELALMHLSIDANNVQYFAAPMNFSNYFDASPTRFFLKIIAFDSAGKQIMSELRPFCSSGRIGKLKWSLKEYFVMGIVWDALYGPLLWAGFGILLFLLVVQKLYIYLVLGKGRMFRLRQKNRGSTTGSFLNEVLVEVHHATTSMWWMQLLLVGYLMCMPWFWAAVFGDSYPLGSMSVKGWSVSVRNSEEQKHGLGVPDIIVIVLPFLYHILLPLFVLVFALYFEQALVSIHIQHVSQRCRGPSKSTKHTFSCKLCARWLRKALLVVCMGVACLHAQRTRAIVGAYGMSTMLISPGYIWPVPILLVTAVLQSAKT